jgi:hypothetical protein
VDEIARFKGSIYKVQTLAAGGFRVTLDGTSMDIAQAAFLMPYADTPGVIVEVIFRTVEVEQNDGEYTHKRRKMHI